MFKQTTHTSHRVESLCRRKLQTITSNNNNNNRSIIVESERCDAERHATIKPNIMNNSKSGGDC